MLYSITIDTTLPTIAIDANLEEDNVVNAAEDNNFTVTGTTTGVEVGRIVNVTVSDSVERHGPGDRDGERGRHLDGGRCGHQRVQQRHHLCDGGRLRRGRQSGGSGDSLGYARHPRRRIRRPICR